MLNNYLHLFFLNKGADHWPQSQGGCSLGGIPSFAAFKFSGKSALSSLCCQWNDERPKDLRGQSIFCLFCVYKVSWELIPEFRADLGEGEEP